MEEPAQLMGPRLVCDALALALTGPSFLYASAAFLPAPSPGAMGSHPYAADRLRLSLEQLKALGWGDYLAAATPTILMWVKSLQSATPPPATPQEEFMRARSRYSPPRLPRWLGITSTPFWIPRTTHRYHQNCWN